MAIVTYNGETFECVKAVKGTADVCGFSFIHLLDADDNLLHAFDNVTDFTAFTISGGSWSTLSPDKCYLAVVGTDGRVYKSTTTCSEVLKKPRRELFNYTLDSDLTRIADSTGFEYDFTYLGQGRIAMSYHPKNSMGHNVDIWVMSMDRDPGVYYRITDQRYVNNEDIFEYVLPWTDIPEGVTVALQFFY